MDQLKFGNENENNITPLWILAVFFYKNPFFYKQAHLDSTLTIPC